MAEQSDVNQRLLDGLLMPAGISDSRLESAKLLGLLCCNNHKLDDSQLFAKSGLNDNGNPVQFVVSSGAHPVRVLADVAHANPSQYERLQSALDVANKLSQTIGFTQGLPSLDTLLRCMLPSGIVNDKVLNHGAMWVAVGYGLHGADRLSVYADGSWGAEPTEHWLRPFRLLLQLGCEESANWLRTLLPIWIDRVAPAGIGLDFDGNGLSLIKVYFRTRVVKSGLLDELSSPDVGILHNDAFQKLSNLFFPDSDLPRGSFFALGFKPQRARPFGIKLDFCAHCTGFNDMELRSRWIQYAAELGIDSTGYSRAAALFSKECGHELFHANLGVGIGGGKTRLNAYLRPNSKTRPMRRSNAALEQAQLVAIDYLLDRQSSDGHWEDFSLPVGVSDAWVTAIVGRSLVTAHRVTGSKHVAQALSDAGEWLLACEAERGGWGYNMAVPVDSDSTAQVSLFLTAIGHQPLHLAKVLIQFQQENGGFSTYRKFDGVGNWAKAHPDVTPVVAMALADLMGADAIVVRRALEYCLRSIDTNGTWPSYWWRSHFYTPAMISMLHSKIEQTPPTFHLDRCPEPASNLDIALRILCGAESCNADESYAIQLIQRQGSDGSWSSSKQLCVTDPQCAKPWAETDGYARCFADDQCVFTTAIALHAIALHTNVNFRM